MVLAGDVISHFVHNTSCHHYQLMNLFFAALLPFCLRLLLLTSRSAYTCALFATFKLQVDSQTQLWLHFPDLPMH